MDLSDGAWGTNGAGTPLCAVAAPAVIQSGDNTITMYARYPLVCQMSSDAAGQGAAITGTAPAYYTNGSPTPLPAATESYVDGSGTTLRFAGWALTDGGTPVISGSVPSTGVYKGKLTLWACYSECTVSISTGAAGTDPILAEGDTLALTAVPAGFPSAPAYTWSIESPAADAPVTVSASGVVSPVPGKSGSATIKVTAVCGALTATATQNVSVAALSVTGAAAVEAMRLADGSKSVSASVSGYTGTVEYSWTSSSTAVAAVSPADSASVTVAPASGGITTLSVTAVLKDGSGSTIKVLPVKTIDAAVLEVVLGGSGLPANTTDPIVLTAGSTETAALTATLRGISSGVTYAWESGAPSLFTVSPANTSGTTVTPVAAGSDSVTATLTYKGVSVSASRNVSVAGITIGGTATHVWNEAAASHTMSLSVEPVGLPVGADVTYNTGDYSSSDTDVAIVTAGGSPAGTTINVTVKKGGQAVITAKATYGGKPLTATKTISILQLQLGGSGLPANPADPIVLTAGSTDSAALSASLVGGLTADSWAWQSGDEDTFTVSPADADATVISPVAIGSSTVTVKATYDGAEITASRDVNVAGLKITGSKVFTKGAAGKTLPTEFEGFATAPTVTSWTWSSGTETVATASGSTGTASLGLLAGGKTTVSVDAVVGGKTLHAEKDIYVLDLVVDIPAGTELDGSGNPKLALGDTLDLTASLAGLTAADLTELGVTFSWGSQTPAAATVNPADEAATTVIPIADDTSVVIRAMVWYLGANTLATDTTVVIPEGLPLANVANYLKNLPAITTSDPPYVVPAITGLTKDNWTQIKDALKASTSANRYVDLSATTLPSDITTLYQGFKYCTTLVKSPQLPASMTGGSMKECFEGCRNLTTAPAVPDGITEMNSCFSNCENLTDISALTIPGTVTNLNYCFESCKKLVTAPAIPDAVTSMAHCFSECNKLAAAPELPDELLNMNYCFSQCYALTSFPTIPSKVTGMKSAFNSVGRTSGMTGSITIPSSVTDMESCFYGTKGTFDVNIYAIGCNKWNELIRDGQEWNVTIHVPSGSSLKSRIQSGTYNSSLTIQEDL